MTKAGIETIRQQMGGPVASGDVYCSPWCGCGCKRLAYDRAVADAAALAAVLGDGWEPVVWENAGWHFKATKGIAEVHSLLEGGGALLGTYTVRGYQAWINCPVAIHDRMVQFIKTAPDPNDALGLAKQEARTFVSHLESALAEILA